MTALVCALFACAELIAGRSFKGTDLSAATGVLVLWALVFDGLLLIGIWRRG